MVNPSKQAARAGELQIDFSQKELYLNAADFQTVFKMNRVRGGESLRACTHQPVRR